MPDFFIPVLLGSENAGALSHVLERDDRAAPFVARTESRGVRNDVPCLYRAGRSRGKRCCKAGLSDPIRTPVSRIIQFPPSWSWWHMGVSLAQLYSGGRGSIGQVGAVDRVAALVSPGFEQGTRRVALCGARRHGLRRANSEGGRQKATRDRPGGVFDRHPACVADGRSPPHFSYPCVRTGIVGRFAVKMTRDWDEQSPATRGCVFTAHGARDDLRQGGSSGCPGLWPGGDLALNMAFQNDVAVACPHRRRHHRKVCTQDYGKEASSLSSTLWGVAARASRHLAERP